MIVDRIDAAPPSPYELNTQTRLHAEEFVSKTKELVRLPHIELNPKSSVFVCIPVYREFANSDRLYMSWWAQNMPPELHGDIIFLVNNRQNDSPEVREDNDKTYRDLQKSAQSMPHPQLGFHVIDTYSDSSALPEDTTIGSIRNLSVLPVIEHALETGKNGLIFSTDADSFPYPNVIANLGKVFRNEPSMYGVVERVIEFTDDFTPEDKKAMQKLEVVASCSEMLLDYLTFGKWEFPVTTGGANTFYTIDSFVNIGGYNPLLTTGEDIDLANRLRVHDREKFEVLVTTYITNLTRISDRVEGDGRLLQELKSEGWRVPFNAQTLLQHVDLRHKLFNILTHNSQPTEEVESINRVIDTLYEGRSYSLDEAMVSLNDLILTLLGEDKEFLDIYAHFQSKGRSVYFPGIALLHYVSRKYKEG
jgi:hypothetical protein